MHGRYRSSHVLAMALVSLAPATRAAEDLPPIDDAGLPPRASPRFPDPRPVPRWLRDHLRVGHLPGSLPMAREFLKAGYDVVTLNVLGNWEVVGPSAALYPAERVKRAEEYMRAHVKACHDARAKAIFYLGPVQVPSGNEAFVKAHPDWLLEMVTVNGTSAFLCVFPPPQFPQPSESCVGS